MDSQANVARYNAIMRPATMPVDGLFHLTLAFFLTLAVLLTWFAWNFTQSSSIVRRVYCTCTTQIHTPMQKWEFGRCNCTHKKTYSGLFTFWFVGSTPVSRFKVPRLSGRPLVFVLDVRRLAAFSSPMARSTQAKRARKDKGPNWLP